MPRYFCDYCDVYLTHDSAPGRKQHIRGWKHRENVKQYYEQYMKQFYEQNSGMGMMPPGMAMGSLGALTAGRAPVGLLGHAAARRRAAARAHGRARLDPAAAARLPAGRQWACLPRWAAIPSAAPPRPPPGFPPMGRSAMTRPSTGSVERLVSAPTPSGSIDAASGIGAEELPFHQVDSPPPPPPPGRRRHRRPPAKLLQAERQRDQRGARRRRRRGGRRWLIWSSVKSDGRSVGAGVGAAHMAARTAAASVTAASSAAAGSHSEPGSQKTMWRIAPGHRKIPRSTMAEQCQTASSAATSHSRGASQPSTSCARVEGLRGVVALPLHDERLDDASEAEALEAHRFGMLAQQPVRLRRGPDSFPDFGVRKRRVVVVDALSRGLGRRRRAADRRRRGLDGDEASRVEDVHVRVGGLDGPGGRVDPDMIVSRAERFYRDELDAMGGALAGDAAHDGVRRVPTARPARAHQTPPGN